MAKNKKAGMSIGGILLVVAIVLIARLLGIDLNPQDSTESPPPPAQTQGAPRATPGAGGAADDAGLVEELFAEERSGVMVTVEAEVVHILPDDNEGSRHQRFLIELSPDRTLLVAHNIDLADRVPLRDGDTILIRGQYEWTEKGGTLHWTHHDPGNRREGGWIEHAGARYE